MLLSNYAICGKEKLAFIKNQELRNFSNKSSHEFKINKIINKFLLTGDQKFMPELDLKQSEFKYRGCGPFTKHRERVLKFRKTGNLRDLYRSELDKACFAHNAAYSDSKDLAKRTISDKTVKNRTYKIVRNNDVNMMDIKEHQKVWFVSF